jgi:hypothetical protein
LIPSQQTIRLISTPKTSQTGGVKPKQENAQESTRRIIRSYRAARSPLSRNPRRKKNRRFLQSALEDPTPELAEALERYRRGQLSLVALADHMRGAVYLRGCTVYDSLRPEQVGAALEELGVEQEEQAAGS